MLSIDAGDDSDDDDDEISTHDQTLPIVSGGKSSRRSRSAMAATPIKWKARRGPLTASLYQEFNTSIFGDKLPSDLSITWNARLLRTAGLTHMRALGSVRTARIDLASKVVTDELRLRSTLLHELCHVAAWLIDGVRKPPRSGLQKVGTQMHEGLPRCDGDNMPFI